MFGPEWEGVWRGITRNRLMGNGFNTIGNWSDTAFARWSGMPWVYQPDSFPSTETRLYRDFPDVLSPEYAQNAEIFARQLRGLKNDRALIGYFLRNEPQWAFSDADIAFEMFRVSDPSFSKMKFTNFLSARYQGNIDSLNRAWNIQVSGFDEIRNLCFKEYPSEQSKTDFRLFTDRLVEAYLRIPSEAARKVDPVHLNLGLRFAGFASDRLLQASGSIDVFSFNSYAFPHAAPTADIAAKINKPVLIGEFHFGALDAGLPSNGLIGVASQTDRGLAYRTYLEEAFSRPEIIGVHYFQWMDQAVAGRSDGENFNIGFNDILYQPHSKLSEAARESHLKVYRIASGKEIPLPSTARQATSVAH